MFKECAAEERWTAKLPIPDDLQAPGVAWVRQAAARGDPVDALRRVWMATVPAADGEYVDVEPLATPLALAVASNLDKVAQALLQEGADPFWGFDLSEFGGGGKVEICHLAEGWSDHGWRGKFCLDLVHAARERSRLVAALARASKPRPKRGL